MFDFLKITNDYDAKKKRYVYKPSFIIKSNIRDLMTRARDFYAIFDENTNLWVTDEDIAIEMIDKQTIAAAQKITHQNSSLIQNVGQLCSLFQILIIS